MGLCNSIDNNTEAPCEFSAGGIEDRIYIVERKNIDQALLALAYDSNNKVKLNDLPLLAGKNLYFIDGIRSSFVPSSTFSEVGPFTQELHSIEMTVYKSDVETKWLVELMKNGKFVVVYRNNDGEFEVLGLGAGLQMTAKAYTPALPETRRSQKITFASKATQQEPYGPATLLKVNATTTLAYLESKIYIPIIISPVILGVMQKNVTFTETLTQTGISGTPVWSVSAGVLPTGVTLNNTTGIIAGLPSVSGNYSFQISVTDGANTGIRSYTGAVLE